MKRYTFELLKQDLNEQIGITVIEYLWKLALNTDHGMITISGLVIMWQSILSVNGNNIDVYMNIDRTVSGR